MEKLDKTKRSLILYTQSTNNIGHSAMFERGDIKFGCEINRNCWYPETMDEFELNVQLKNY